MLSLALLVPFGAGSVTERIAKTVAAVAAPGPVKHVTLVHDGLAETVETHAASPDDLLAEQGLVRADDDALSVDPAGQLDDGETVVYRAAVPVTVVDGQPRELRSSAANVGDLLTAQRVAWDRHDDIAPAPATPLANDATVTVRHVDRWTETVHRTIPPQLLKRYAIGLRAGTSKLIRPGAPGIVELSYAVSRTADRRSLRRTVLVSRVLRAPHARIVAEGIGEYAALSQLAERGIAGTLKLATSALSMVATAYTAGCSGCSGITASGRPAGHGVVAVDPHVIPLGTRMFIPGYGHAIAGDTGGAIRGLRIDLGFDSNRQAFQFGRRPVVVYLYK
jgi:3D (Asp-Asp-Asp) domain-containing protein